MNNKIDTNQNRRQFLSTIFPACAVTCLGCSSVFANTQSKVNYKANDKKEKFQNDFCRTYEKAWQWKFNDYINIIEELAKVIGREKLIKMIKNGTDEISLREAENRPNIKLSEFSNSLNGDYYNNALTFEIIENTDELLEFKVTECLWAKTYRERNAEDVGYATNCHSDFSFAKARNQLHLERTKTLMQGFDCCNFRWIFKS